MPSALPSALPSACQKAHRRIQARKACELVGLGLWLLRAEDLVDGTVLGCGGGGVLSVLLPSFGWERDRVRPWGVLVRSTMGLAEVPPQPSGLHLRDPSDRRVRSPVPKSPEATKRQDGDVGREPHGFQVMQLSNLRDVTMA